MGLYVYMLAVYFAWKETLEVLRDVNNLITKESAIPPGQPCAMSSQVHIKVNDTIHDFLIGGCEP
jgi:hypothetical protein